MAWHDDVAAALPPVEPDDPADLRCDLVDEIADHLWCAMERELRKDGDGDEEAARGRVLKRFGDVRSVLRRLWFDSLWERIVAQRITLVAAVVLAIGSLVLCGLVWSIATSVQKTNREMLELLAKRPDPIVVPQAPAAPISLDWNPLAIELVSAGTDEPIVGWSVEVTGHLHTETDDAYIEEKSNDEGRAEMGLVRPGQHRIRILSPWNESTSFSYTVRPGEENVVRIECPSANTTETTAELTFTVPRWDFFREEGCSVMVNFNRVGREVANHHWHDSTDYVVLLQPDGTVVQYEGEYSDRSNGAALYGEPRTLEGKRLTLPAGTYATGRVRIVKPGDVSTNARETLVRVLAPSDTVSRFGQFPGSPRLLRSEEPRPQSFEAAAGEGASQWNVVVPDEVVGVAWVAVQGEVLGLDPNGRDTSSVYLAQFFEADANGDGGLTADEYETAFGARDPEMEAEWPMNVKAYVEEKQASRARRGAGGFRRPDTPRSSPAAG